MRNKIILIVVIVLALIFGRMILSNMDKIKTTKMRAMSGTPAVTVGEVG